MWRGGHRLESVITNTDDLVCHQVHAVLVRRGPLRRLVAAALPRLQLAAPPEQLLDHALLCLHSVPHVLPATCRTRIGARHVASGVA